jgi:hypothetical protein
VGEWDKSIVLLRAPIDIHFLLIWCIFSISSLFNFIFNSRVIPVVLCVCLCRVHQVRYYVKELAKKFRVQVITRLSPNLAPLFRGLKPHEVIRRRIFVAATPKKYEQG